MSGKKTGAYNFDRNLVPRVQQYLEANKHKKYIDVYEMADSLQLLYPEYGRKKKIPFRLSVEKAYSEAKEVLGEDVSVSALDSDIDLTEAYDESVASPIRKEGGNELMRGMYGKQSDKNSKPLDDMTDIMVIDVLGNRQIEETPVEKTPTRSIKKKKRKIMDETTDAHKELGSSKTTKDFKAIKSEVTFAEIGGNEKSLEDVCKLIIHMKHPEVYTQLGVSPPRGFLLHGPPGCGKTLLAHAIAGELQIPFLKVAATELVSGVSGESEEQIRHLFDQATSMAPCIVFIDEIDAITPKRETAQREMERRIVAQLLTCMDDLSRTENKAHVLVIGATNRPDSLDTALRRAGRFDREIALGIPDEATRERILRVLCRNLTLEPDLDWKYLAKHTPGYVGADMMALTREAAMVAVNRVFTDLQSQFVGIGVVEKVDAVANTNHREALLVWLREQQPLTDDQLKSLCISTQDFREALKCVQPSAQREGFATVPDVTWDDIGALSNVRQELIMAILAPIRHAEQFEAVGLTSPSGVLLCGPPGCGKTLLAKAVANEAGINFISVKGPELLNMYVGESERAVRTCFQRARHSTPCVIFFDEIDALCPRRSDHGEGGASVRVVNQLLTEMDGVESRRGVFLMAATNRPDIIDPAVLRPGRLDKILHVGFPTAEDRVDILRALTKNGTRPKLAADVTLQEIGHDSRLDGYTGADLSSLVKESAVQALQEFVFNQTSQPAPDVYVHLRHFQAGIDKIRPSVNEKDRKYYIAMTTKL